MPVLQVPDFSNNTLTRRKMILGCAAAAFAIAALPMLTAGAQETPRRRPRGDATAGDPSAGESGAIAPQPNVVRGDEITPQQQIAVAAGLEWLARKQGRDGSFQGESMGKHAGISALAGLAFMQAGNLPGRGKYGDNVDRALDYVLSCAQESGLIA